MRKHKDTAIPQGKNLSSLTNQGEIIRADMIICVTVREISESVLFAFRKIHEFPRVAEYLFIF